jgi:hypothetical protein
VLLACTGFGIAARDTVRAQARPEPPKTVLGRKEVARAQGDQEVTLASRAAVDAFLERTGGQMWITHDLIGFSKLKKSPAFYE